jgi:hypothetical protein
LATAQKPEPHRKIAGGIFGQSERQKAWALQPDTASYGLQCVSEFDDVPALWRGECLHICMEEG